MLTTTLHRLLITLLCSSVAFVSPAEEEIDIKQLAGTVKLLQLQLKQTTETVEHISALLSGHELQSPTPSDTSHTTVTATASVPSLSTPDGLTSSGEVPNINKLSASVHAPDLVYAVSQLQLVAWRRSDETPSAEHWPSDQLAGQTHSPCCLLSRQTAQSLHSAS